jgi:hypothetical protein
MMRLIEIFDHLKSLISNAKLSVHWICLIIPAKPNSIERSTKMALTHTLIYKSVVRSISFNTPFTKSRFNIIILELSSLVKKQRRLRQASMHSDLGFSPTRSIKISIAMLTRKVCVRKRKVGLWSDITTRSLKQTVITCHAPSSSFLE